jgi:NhaP-type Na+/H+ or K+/H+ antiporter
MLKDPVLGTAVSFIVPFLAWVPATELGASGVLAAVVTGLVTGHQGPGLLPARDRLAETVNWETVAFLLESGIFLLMGLQLKTLVDADAAAGLTAVSWTTRTCACRTRARTPPRCSTGPARRRWAGAAPRSRTPRGTPTPGSSTAS